MVERIESLDAQLKRPPLSDREFPAHRQIQLGHAEPVEGVSSQIPLHGIGRRPKGRSVETPAARRGPVRDPVRLARRQVGPEGIFKTDSRRLLGVQQGNGKTRASVNNPIQRPAAPWIGSAASRDFIAESGRERLADIEIGGSAIAGRGQP